MYAHTRKLLVSFCFTKMKHLAFFKTLSGIILDSKTETTYIGHKFCEKKIFLEQAISPLGGIFHDEISKISNIKNVLFLHIKLGWSIQVKSFVIRSICNDLFDSFPNTFETFPCTHANFESISGCGS